MTMKPTKITIRCEADSPRGFGIRAYRTGARRLPRKNPYFAEVISPGEEAVFDKHEGVYIIVEDFR